MTKKCRILVGELEETLQNVCGQTAELVREYLATSVVTRLQANFMNWIQVEQSANSSFRVVFADESSEVFTEVDSMKKIEKLFEAFPRDDVDAFKQYCWNPFCRPAPHQRMPLEIEPVAQSSSDGDEHIYILINGAMPGIVKIGRAERDPEERARERSAHTGVPAVFSVYRTFRVKDSIEAERSIHRRLDS